MQYVSHTLTVACPLAYHTAHHRSSSMSGLNEPLHVQLLASFNTSSTTHPPQRSLTERLSYNAGHGLFSRDKMARQSGVNLRVRVRGDICIVPVLSRRAWLSSRTLKPKTGNQKLAILDTNARTFHLNWTLCACGERAHVSARNPALSRRTPSFL